MVLPYMNLNRVSAVIVESDKYVLELVSQTLKGFGLVHQACFETGEAAKSHIASGGGSLCLIEAVLPDMSGFDLVRWVRRLEAKEIRTTPIIMLTGYTQKEAVRQARDCGANSVIKKPVQPQVLFDRIAWIAKNERQFVEARDYVGPDRRVKLAGPPGGVGRRSTDLSAGTASDSNMLQDEIDDLLKPIKAKAP